MIEKFVNRRDAIAILRAKSFIRNFNNETLIFADINCNIGLKSKDRLYYFNSEGELDGIISKLAI